LEKPHLGGPTKVFSKVLWHSIHVDQLYVIILSKKVLNLPQWWETWKLVDNLLWNVWQCVISLQHLEGRNWNWTYPMTLFKQIKKNYFSYARRKWMHNKVLDFKLSTWWWIYILVNFPRHKSHQTIKGRNQNLFLWTLEVHIHHRHMQIGFVTPHLKYMSFC
jgi:hypothetical protein